MSASAVTGNMVSEMPADTLQVRARRGFTAAGWIALLVGLALGFVQANSNGVLSRLPFALTADVATLVLTALLGLVCGAIIGLWLWGSSGVLRFLISFIAILVGVLSTEITRGLLLKISLREALVSYNDLLEGVQLLVGALGALIGIRTGHASPEQLAELTTGDERAFTLGLPWRIHRSPIPETAAEPTRQAPARRRRRTRRSGTSRSMGTQRATRSASRGGPAPPDTPPSVQITRPAPTPSRLRSKRRKLGRGRKVHLGRQVSTVCPYCLEEVLPNDPRGRVVCRICRTPHHGDCWAISGKCEVPHLQT